MTKSERAERREEREREREERSTGRSRVEKRTLSWISFINLPEHSEGRWGGRDGGTEERVVDIERNRGITMGEVLKKMEG